MSCCCEPLTDWERFDVGDCSRGHGDRVTKLGLLAYPSRDLEEHIDP